MHDLLHEVQRVSAFCIGSYSCALLAHQCIICHFMNKLAFFSWCAVCATFWPPRLSNPSYALGESLLFVPDTIKIIYTGGMHNGVAFLLLRLDWKYLYTHHTELSSGVNCRAGQSAGN